MLIANLKVFTYVVKDMVKIIRPSLDFGAVVGSVEEIYKLERIQRIATRFYSKRYQP